MNTKLLNTLLLASTFFTTAAFAEKPKVCSDTTYCLTPPPCEKNEKGEEINCKQHHDRQRGRVSDAAKVVPTQSRYSTSNNRLPENSERLLPDEIMTLWLSDESLDEPQLEDKVIYTKKLVDENITKKLNNAVDPIRFKSGRSEIPDGYVQKLRDVLGGMRNRRNVRLNFIGHTDSDRLGARARAKYGDNQGLSEARAALVASYFQKQLGLPAEAIVSEGRGESEPLASNENEAGKLKNRRVEIQVWYDEVKQKEVVEETVIAAQPVKRVKVCRQRITCYEKVIAEKSEQVKIKNAVPPIRFASGRSDIPQDYVQKLKSALDQYGEKPNVVVRFIGHTDNDRLGSRARKIYGNNTGLSKARARRVATFFQQALGLSSDSVSTDGKGEFEPLASNDSNQGKALNRRVEIEIWHDVPVEDREKVTPLSVCPTGDDLYAIQADPNRQLIQRNETFATGNPFALADFRITVDGEPVNDTAVHGADVQRCTDVALEKADIQVQYDSLTAEPRLNVVASPAVTYIPSTGDDQLNSAFITFQAYSNYPAFFQRAEVRLFDKDQALTSEPKEILVLNENMQASWPVDQSTLESYGREIHYTVRVYGRGEVFDETRAQRLWLSDRALSDEERKAEQQAHIDNLLSAYGESKLALQNIPVNGGTVTVNGRGVPAAYKVWVMDHTVPVAGQGEDEGRFVAQRIIPHGLHQVEVNVLDSEGSGDVFLRDLQIKQRDWFAVGIADLTFGVDKTNGPAALVTQDETHYDSGSFADGRLAFYLKGKTRKNYTLTASADTREQPIDDLFTNFNDKDPQTLFRRLDQDYYYPTFGDDSTTVEDAPTQGKFFVKLEKNKSYGLLGNFEAEIVDTDLAQIDRGLYGAYWHYESQGITSIGEDRTRIDIFAAEPGTVSAREDFRGTGGSLYFLKHQDISIGSERLRIEVRDKDSGIVMSTRDLVAGQDYDIDALQGRVMLLAPLASTSTDGLVVQSSSLNGNPNYLVARYEYSPGIEELDELATGARISHWFGDSVKLGLSASDIEQTGGDQTLGGVDLTIRNRRGDYIKLESATTEGPNAGELSSSDGGFNFATVNQGTNANTKADASRIEGAINIGSARIQAYMQERDAGYSAPGQLTANDVEQQGLRLQVPLGSTVRLNVKHDDKEEANRLSTEATDLDINWQANEHWSFALAGRRDDRVDNATTVVATQQQGERTDVALKAAYDSLDNLSIYGFVQDTSSVTGNRDSNDRAGIGGAYQISQRVKIDAEISDGDLGSGAKIGTDYLLNDRTNLYLAYALENDRTDTGLLSRQSSVTSGFKTRYNDALSIYGEERYTSGDVPTGLTHAYGIQLAPNDYWTFGLSIENGTLEDPDTAAKTERTALGFTGGYGNQKTEYGYALEFREDDSTTENRETIVLKNTLNYQVNPDWRFLGKLNLSESDSSRGEFFDGDFTELVLGYGYRPIRNDRWNTLFKYTYFYNRPTTEQESNNATTNIVQRSHILSFDTSYDISKRWTLGGKYGFRRGEVSLDRANLNFFSSDAHLLVLNAEWHVVKGWDALIEARMLDLPDAQDRRDGFLFAGYKHFGRHIKLGVGYNYTDFSDDLTDLDFDSQGVFINIIGKY